MSPKTEKRSHHKPRPVDGPPEPTKRGRSRKPISEDEIVRLAAKGSSDDYISWRLGISKTLLSGKYKNLLDSGKAVRNGAILRRQFQLAMDGNVPMLIWLGRNLLNQCNRVEPIGDDPLKELVFAMNRRSEQIGPPENSMPTEDAEEEALGIVGQSGAPD